jgi:hypothetical protein
MKGADGYAGVVITLRRSASLAALAVSLSNDAEAKALAVSYGAESLLDKMKLYDQMIQAIMSCCKAQEIRYPGRQHPDRC